MPPLAVLISWNTWVDVARPGIDATFEIDYLREAVLTQIDGYAKTPHASMTHDDYRLLRGNFANSLRDLPHRNVYGALDRSDSDLMVLAYIEQNDLRSVPVIGPPVDELDRGHARYTAHRRINTPA